MFLFFIIIIIICFFRFAIHQENGYFFSALDLIVAFVWHDFKNLAIIRRCCRFLFLSSHFYFAVCWFYVRITTIDDLGF